MPRPPAKARAYKELTFQQLRSFHETARLGSMAAAARSLGLTHPTVREQVLALERDFDARLVEPYRRGCHLTAEGRLLAELAAPLVASAAALKQRFDQARSQAEIRLVVAGPPRVVQEDLPPSVIAFLDRQPHVRVAFLEVRDDEVARAVETGTADFGLTSDRIPDQPPPGMSFEPGYELETLLLVPKRHPLARARQVRPEDLRRWPLVTTRYTLADQPELAAILDRASVFEGPAPRVEPFLAETVRRYVELGQGIALVYGLPGRRRSTTLIERSMSHYFGRALVRFIYRAGGAHETIVRALAATIQATNRAPPRTSRKRKAR